MTKILIDEAVVRHALDTLEVVWKDHQAITALRQALEKPAPAREPVAWAEFDFRAQEFTGRTATTLSEVESVGLQCEWVPQMCIPTTAPAQPLTDEQRLEIIRQADGSTSTAVRLTEQALTQTPPAPTNCRHCGGAENVICARQCKEQPTRERELECVIADLKAECQALGAEQINAACVELGVTKGGAA